MRRPLSLLAVSGLLATSVVLVPGTQDASAAPTTECRLVEGGVTVPGTSVQHDDTTATTPGTTIQVSVLQVVVVSDGDGAGDALTIGRQPGSREFRIEGSGLSATSCGGATIDNVDTVEVRIEAQPNGLAFDPLTLTVDVSNGPLAPGKRSDFDLFGLGFAEDETPEIEVDVHLSRAGSAFNLPAMPRLDLVVIGSEGPDHAVAGKISCPQDATSALCREWKVNLNAASDEDADLAIVSNDGTFAENGGWVNPPFLATFRAEGGGGDDVLSAAGGRGTGRPLFRILGSGGGGGNAEFHGGPGNDTLLGGDESDVLTGGPGNDRLSGGNGNDTLEGGAGQDVIDEGVDINGGDAISGGDGRDAVEYSARLRPVTVIQNGLADDGEFGEGDEVSAIEDVRLPQLSTGEGFGGVRELGTIPAPTNCASAILAIGASNAKGPCPLVVDPEHSVGFAYGTGKQGDGLYLYDLRALGEPEAFVSKAQCAALLTNESKHDEASLVLPGWSHAPCGVPTRGAFDTARSDLYAPVGVRGISGNLAGPANCGLVRVGYEAPALPRVDWVRYGGCLPPSPANVAGPIIGDPGEYAEAYAANPLAARHLVHLSLSFDSALDGLWAAGMYQEDAGPARDPWPIGTADPFSFPRENLGQPLVVRQIRATGEDDPATATVNERGLTFSWDLDLRYAGCGRRVGSTTGDPFLRPFVARVGSNLLAYCWDTRPGPAGQYPVGNQGYLVRIPLGPDHRPLPQSDQLLTDSNGAFVNYRYVRTPTFPGHPDVVVDPVEEKVVIVTDGPVNGNAAWIFDPEEDRFIGVSSGGAVTQPKGNTAVGVDPLRGRAYMTTQDGLLVVPSRARPLPAGLIYPVGVNVKHEADFVNFPLVGVAPKLRRVFLPLNLPDQEGPAGARYVVVEDGSPEPAVADADPDANTAQVDEQPGVTEVRANGAARGSGAHVVITGGAARAVDQAEPGCNYDVQMLVPVAQDGDGLGAGAGGSPERGEVATLTLGFGTLAQINQPLSLPFRPFGNDGCAADQVLTPGHREAFLAETSSEAGSGSVARGAALSFGSADVTENDVKKRGDCEASTVAGTASQRYGPFPEDMKGDAGFRQFQAGVDEGYEQLADGYDDGCDGLWDAATGQGEAASGNANDPRNEVPDPRTGTEGRDGKGFPLKAARCADFGSGADADAEGQRPLAAATTCEHAATSAAATSEAPGLVLSAGGVPQVVVASTASSVRSFRDAEDGQVTVSLAAAQGVVVGPVSIREVRSVAVARAKGRTGTAQVDFERRWCGVSVEGQDPLPGSSSSSTTTTSAPGSSTTTRPAVVAPSAPGVPPGTTGCIDPASPENAEFLEALNRSLLGKLRLSLPDANEETEADGTREAGADSPGGYQAVLTKHEDQRGGDLVVNDDDSHTVAGLEAVYYNDGTEGRNRVVVQLAGVHAESRYGITLLPKFSSPEGVDGFGGGTPGAPGTPGTPGTTRFLPGSVPEASAIVEGEVFEYIMEGGGLAGLRDDLPTDPIRRFLRWVPDAVKDLLRLFIQHPVEFALLFLVFSMLAAPAYLAYRRRTFVGVVAG